VGFVLVRFVGPDGKGSKDFDLPKEEFMTSTRSTQQPKAPTRRNFRTNIFCLTEIGESYSFSCASIAFLEPDLFLTTFVIVFGMQDAEAPFVFP
jgi:hypothetical protein